MMARLLCLVAGHRGPTEETELVLSYCHPRVSWACPRCGKGIWKGNLR
jgi:hypothetical protein